MNFRRAFFWLDDLSTGITFLDDELQGLFERFLDLIDEMERHPELSRFADGMETIAHDIQVHFLHEEHVMRKIEYPDYKAHRAEHERLIEGLSEFVDNLGVGFSEEHLPAVTHYFAKWLMSHVKEHDVKIKQYLDEPVRQPESVRLTPPRIENAHVAELQTARFGRRRSA